MAAFHPLSTLIRLCALAPLATAMTAASRCCTARVFLARCLGAPLFGGERCLGRGRLFTTVRLINARHRRWLRGQCLARLGRLSKEHHAKPLETEFGLLQGKHQPKMPPQHMHHHAPIVGRPPRALDPLDQRLAFFRTQRHVLGPFHRGRFLETPRQLQASGADGDDGVTVHQPACQDGRPQHERRLRRRAALANCRFRLA